MWIGARGLPCCVAVWTAPTAVLHGVLLGLLEPRPLDKEEEGSLGPVNGDSCPVVSPRSVYSMAGNCLHTVLDRSNHLAGNGFQEEGGPCNARWPHLVAPAVQRNCPQLDVEGVRWPPLGPRGVAIEPMPLGPDWVTAICQLPQTLCLVFR